MKTYTDLEQSEKLVEILPIKSADMCYPLPCEDGDKPLLEQGGFGSTPCWSLAALLECLRKHDLFPEIKDADDYILMDIYFYDENEVVEKVINPVHFIRAEGKNILDACYEMIIKLKAQNLI